MSQAPPAFPPPGEPSVRASSLSGSTTSVWWVVAGLAVLVSVALIVWLVVTSGSPGVGPTEPSLSSTAPTVDPTDVDPSGPDGVDWGEFPPNNVDSLKDLSDPVFPTMLGAFTLEKESRDDYSVFTNYDNSAESTGMTADVAFNTSSYAGMVQDMPEPAYVGRAVCGVSTGGVGRDVTCVMAGKSETLMVGSASTDIGVDDVAAFTEELYDAF